MKKRILVVEDHEDTRVILRALLTYYGYEMFEAQSAEQMLDDVDTVRPDLVVLDVCLPGIDGCEGLARLRDRGFDKPVFLFSEAYERFDDNIQACPADAFYSKSAGPIELIEAIGRKLNSAA